MNFANGKYKTRNGTEIELRNYVAVHGDQEFGYDRDGNVKYYQQVGGEIVAVKGPHEMDIMERVDWRVRR